MNRWGFIFFAAIGCSFSPLPGQSAADAGPDSSGTTTFDRTIPRWHAIADRDQFSGTELVVHDTETGLAWMATPLDAVMFDDAPALCAGVALEGISNWTVPTRVELETIVYYMRTNPAHSFQFSEFTDDLWTSSTSAVSPSLGWSLFMTNGQMLPKPKNRFLRVLCVHAPETKQSSPRFVVTETTVFDSITELTWERHASSQEFSKLQAENYCQHLPNGTWRLPTIQELVTILDERRAHPAFAAEFELSPATAQAITTWSSTPEQGALYPAFWAVDFDSGMSIPRGNTSDSEATEQVRCVR